MPMDGLTAGFAARELNETLRGGRIDRITQPERDTVVLVIRAGGANHRLLLCASPNNARCHLTMGTYSNPLEPLPLCMMMRKQLTLVGSRLQMGQFEPVIARFKLYAEHADMMITDTFPFEEADKAFAYAAERHPETGKIVLLFD